MNYFKLLPLSAVLVLAGCPFDDDGSSNTSPPAAPAALERQFEITVTNLTANQPLSPATALLHDDGYSLFEIGQAASDNLEQLAEAGDNSGYQSSSDIVQFASGSDVIPPGSSDTLTVDVPNAEYLTVATMLVNTNDAFAANDGLDLNTIAVGESVTVTLLVWDAGTEANSESAATIPGPAGGGEGFNANRDDSDDSVASHAGVISQDDGLATSALSANHRFQQPAVRMEVKRTQ
uniref:spondin domain-containing protein n=1 Tax=Thaumasiovibrio occultus TaxID=1891184 RepID=UPI000B34BF5D|nr:spondin domain-containing protein [Thaumasiovibrio occultus]